MARCPFARWDPLSGSPGRFAGGPLKIVHHRTQGSTLAGARVAYARNRSDPHFTVHVDGVNQHVDTDYAARSLRNASGGVQTNFDGAIQVEVVGHSGSTMPVSTARHLVRLLRWLRDEHGIPWRWPEGRPPTSSTTGYGLDNGERHPSTWDTVGGRYGHSQVPENTHWDPAYTDEEWRYLNDRMSAEEWPMVRVNAEPVAVLTHASWGSGYVQVCADGGVFNFGGAPFHGSLGGVQLAQPITTAAVTPSGGGYVLMGADGGIFAFGDAAYAGRVDYQGTK